jgi:hypothetical protein
MTLVFQQHYVKTDDCTGDQQQAAFHGCQLIEGSRAGVRVLPVTFSASRFTFRRIAASRAPLLVPPAHRIASEPFFLLRTPRLGTPPQCSSHTRIASEHLPLFKRTRWKMRGTRSVARMQKTAITRSVITNAQRRRARPRRARSSRFVRSSTNRVSAALGPSTMVNVSATARARTPHGRTHAGCPSTITT